MINKSSHKIQNVVNFEVDKQRNFTFDFNYGAKVVLTFDETYLLVHELQRILSVYISEYDADPRQLELEI